jgi:hypothetical protein
MRIQWCITSIFAASLVLLVAGSATAQFDRGNSNGLLQGTYRYTMVVTCSRSGEFTDLPDLRPIGGGFQVTSHTTGLITYDGRGQAHEDQRGIVIFPGPYSPNSESVTIGPIVWDQQHCDWTYKVNRDRTFTQGGDCRGVDKYGPVALGIPGEEVLNTGIKLEGQIGARGQVLIWNQVAPTIETLTTNTGFSTKQVCGYSGTAVRVGRDDD